MKKFLSLVLAAMMLLAMASVAMAEDTFTITINNTLPGHTYVAYQIFAGTADDNNNLTNYTWGTGITEAGKTAFGDPVEKGKTLTDAAAANAFAEAIVAGTTVDGAKVAYLGASAGKTDGQPYKITGLAGGYYLIIDEAGQLTAPTTDSYSLYMMKVAGNVTVKPKVDDVSVEKKVQDVNDSKDTALPTDLSTLTTGWNDTADHDIDDEIPYRLTGTVSEKIGDFDTYYYKFVDTMSKGLTYVDGSAKVYIDNGGTLTEVTNSKISWANQVLTVEFADLKQAKNGENIIPVTKTSKVVVFYKAKLNENAIVGEEGNPNSVELVYATNPYGEGTGTTAPDTNIVFTYQVVVNKVDGYGKPLTGAEFSLYKLVNGSWAKLDLTVKDNVFSFTGLDDGIYKIVEDKAPAGYNAIKPIYFEVVAGHVDDTLSLEELNTTTPTNTTVVEEMANGSVGEFTIDHEEGSLSIDVENLSGAQLPETGGIGTTLFYLFGGLMTAGSALILVVRRRADADEE